MTTDIKVRVNGNYVAEGGITITRKSPGLGEGQTNESRAIKISGVGSQQAVEETFNIPHDSSVTFQMTERPATEEEIADAAAKKAAEGDSKQD